MIETISELVQGLTDSVFKDERGYVSRKLSAAWGLTVLITLLFVAHLPYNWFVIEARLLAPLLSSMEFSAMIVMIWSAYFTANVTEKRSQPLGLEEKEEE